MFHLYSTYLSCHCCHSNWLPMKLRIKIFLLQRKCILSLSISLINGNFSITRNILLLFLSLLTVWNMQVASNCSRRAFPPIKLIIICDFSGLWVKSVINLINSLINWDIMITNQVRVLDSQPQWSLWLCFLPVFEANGVTAVVMPLSARKGWVPPLLLLPRS